jgi:hypothetical protein
MRSPDFASLTPEAAAESGGGGGGGGGGGVGRVVLQLLLPLLVEE